MEVYKAQHQALHHILATASLLDGSSQVITSKQYRKRRREEIVRQAVQKGGYGEDPWSQRLLCCLSKDGSLRAEVSSFLKILVDGTLSASLEKQTILLMVIQKTAVKRRSLLSKFVRCGGLDILKLLMQQCLEYEEGSDEEKAALAVLEMTLEILHMLPYEAMAIRDSNLARFLNQLGSLQQIQEIEGEGERNVQRNRLISVIQKVSDKITKVLKGNAIVGKPAAGSSSMITSSTKNPKGLAVADGEGGQKRVRSDDASSTVDNTSSSYDVEDERRKRELLRKRGRGGGIQVLAADKGIESSSSSVDSRGQKTAAEEEKAAAMEGVSTAVTAVTAESLPQLKSLSEIKKSVPSKRVRWLDKDAGQDLKVVHVFEREDGGAHRGASSISGNESRDRMKELAKKEHLSERDAMHKKSSASQSGSRKRKWKKPRRLLLSRPDDDYLHSEEATVQENRVRASFEMIYRDTDIPSGPCEMAMVMDPNRSLQTEQEIIPWDDEGGGGSGNDSNPSSSLLHQVQHAQQPPPPSSVVSSLFPHQPQQLPQQHQTIELANLLRDLSQGGLQALMTPAAATALGAGLLSGGGLLPSVAPHAYSTGGGRGGLLRTPAPNPSTTLPAWLGPPYSMPAQPPSSSWPNTSQHQQREQYHKHKRRSRK